MVFPVISKLEMYVDILHDLALNGSMHFTEIMGKEKIDALTLRKHLELLVQKDLVEKREVTKPKLNTLLQNRE